MQFAARKDKTPRGGIAAAQQLILDTEFAAQVQGGRLGVEKAVRARFAHKAVTPRGADLAADTRFGLEQAQGGGQIVNIASIFGLLPGPLYSPYVATKHAVVGLSKALRVEAADDSGSTSTTSVVSGTAPISSKWSP